MARKVEKSNLAVIPQESDQIETSPPIPAEKPRPVQKKIKQTSEWIETVDAEEVEEAESEAFEFEDDSIEAILRDFEGVAGEEFFIKVWQLPSYQKDGKRGLNATNRSFCDDIPATPDYLKTIRDTWGAGAYQLELRSQNGTIKNRRMIQIAQPRFPSLNGQQPQVIQNPADPSQPIILNGQQSQVDVGQLLDAEITRYARIAKLFGGQLGGQAENPQPPPLSPELSVAEMLMKDPGHAKQIAKNLLGGDGNQELSWVDVAFKFAENLPDTIKAVKDMIGENQNGLAQMVTPSLANNGQIQNTQGQVNWHQGQMGATQISQTPAQTLPAEHQQPAPDLPPETQLLNLVLQMHLERYAPDTTAEAIREFAAQNPTVQPAVEMFIDTPPPMALTWIKTQVPNDPNLMAVLNHPACEKWIEALQDYLLPEEEGEKANE